MLIIFHRSQVNDFHLGQNLFPMKLCEDGILCFLCICLTYWILSPRGLFNALFIYLIHFFFSFLFILLTELVTKKYFFVSGLAFHPIDGILQAVPHVIALIIVPTHFTSHIGLLFLEAIWTANIHDCIHGKLWPVMGAGYHTIHHTTYRHNYGHYTICMDWMHGTLRDPDEDASGKMMWGMCFSRFFILENLMVFLIVFQLVAFTVMYVVFCL